MSDLEERLLKAVHEADADLELLAHEVAASEDAQAYLIELVATLSALSPGNKVAARAAALLEQGIAIAAEHDLQSSDAIETTARAKATLAKRRGDDEPT